MPVFDFCERVKNQGPNPIRSMVMLVQDRQERGLPAGAFAGGLPNPSTFPIKGLKVELAGGVEIELPDVNTLLQYGHSYGLPSLTKRWKQVVATMHSAGAIFAQLVEECGDDAARAALAAAAHPHAWFEAADPSDIGFDAARLASRDVPTELLEAARAAAAAQRSRRHCSSGGATFGSTGEETGEDSSSVPATSLCVGTGATDLLNRVVDCLVDGESAIMLEDPCYSGFLAMTMPLGCELLAVPTDAEGVVVDALESKVAEYAARTGGRKPKLLYCGATCGNPSGRVMSWARRWELVKACRRAKIPILDDDPYCFLYTSDASRLPPGSLFALDGLLAAGEAVEQPDAGAAADPDSAAVVADLNAKAADDRSMRGERFVVRIESCSKFVSSGIRVGFATGSEVIIGKMALLSSVRQLLPSQTSQGIVGAILDHWHAGDNGMLNGMEAHLVGVRKIYAESVGVFGEQFANSRLESLGVEREPYHGGMFVWLKLPCPSKPVAEQLLDEYGIALMSGKYFRFPECRSDRDPEAFRKEQLSAGEDSQFVRVSLSLAAPESVAYLCDTLERVLTLRQEGGA